MTTTTMQRYSRTYRSRLSVRGILGFLAEADSRHRARVQLRLLDDHLLRDMGITPLAKQLGLTPEQTNGHWCRRCQGIWFGYTLETQCPICGNRNG